MVLNKDEIWSADLVDMQASSSFNKGFKYTLTVIDVFSNYEWENFMLHLFKEPVDNITW